MVSAAFAFGIVVSATFAFGTVESALFAFGTVVSPALVLLGTDVLDAFFASAQFSLVPVFLQTNAAPLAVLPAAPDLAHLAPTLPTGTFVTASAEAGTNDPAVNRETTVARTNFLFMRGTLGSATPDALFPASAPPQATLRF